MIPTLRRPNIALFIALLAPFCKPVAIDTYPLLNRLFQLWKLAALVYLAVALLTTYVPTKPKKKPAGILGLCVFWLIYFLNCLRVGADVVTVGTAAAASIFILLLVSFEIRIGNGMLLLRAMSCLFTLCIAAHILSVLLVRADLLAFGDGTDKTYFLFGYDNYSAFFLYPMLSVILFYRSLRYGRIGLPGWVLMAAVVLTYIYTASMTAAGAGVLMIGLFLLRRYWGKLRKLLQMRWILAAMAVFLVLVCVFQVQNLLASLLDSMNKGVTLNSRTIIWDMALDLIAERPIFGHGSFAAEQINSYILYGTTHAHNLLLEILLRAGVVGGAAYLLFLCGFVRPGRYRKLFRSKAAILVVGLLEQALLFFMDFYPNILVFYCFMALLYHWEALTQPKEKREHNLLEEV